jgi:hypothetical protein
MLKMFITPEVTIGGNHTMTQLQFPNTSTLLPDSYRFSIRTKDHMFKIFKDAVLQSGNVAPVIFSGQAKYQGKGEFLGQYDDMEGILFYSGNQAWLILINKYDKTYHVSQDSLNSALDHLEGLALVSCTEFSPSGMMKLQEALRSEIDFSSRSITYPDSGLYIIKPYSIYTFMFK